MPLDRNSGILQRYWYNGGLAYQMEMGNHRNGSSWDELKEGIVSVPVKDRKYLTAFPQLEYFAPGMNLVSTIHAAAEGRVKELFPTYKKTVDGVPEFESQPVGSPVTYAVYLALADMVKRVAIADFDDINLSTGNVEADVKAMLRHYNAPGWLDNEYRIISKKKVRFDDDSFAWFIKNHMGSGLWADFVERLTPDGKHIELHTVDAVQCPTF